MTVTKAKLIDHLCRNSNFSRDESSTTIESLLEIIKKTLESGEDILISGFGKFIVKEKSERRGRNPATGNDLLFLVRPATQSTYCTPTHAIVDRILHHAKVINIRPGKSYRTEGPHTPKLD